MSTRAFFTDLDHTLIFSPRRALGKVEPEHLVITEHMDNGKPAYAHKEAVRALEEWVAQGGILVPTTTRRSPLYQRIELPVLRDTEYAIVGNGEGVLHHGEYDQEWLQLIMDATEDDPDLTLSFETFVPRLADAAGASSDFRWDTDITSFRITFPKNTGGVPEGIARELEEIAKEMGMRSYVSGRKGYILSSHVTKGKAMSYVLSKMGGAFTYAAGDSSMDQGFLNMADKKFVPKGSYLAPLVKDKPAYTISKKRGIASGEELASFLDLS